MAATAQLDVRAQFPTLDREGVAYLDSAATSQTPRRRAGGDGRLLPPPPRVGAPRRSTRWPPRRPTSSRARARASPRSSNWAAARHGLHAQRHRGAEPRRPRAGAAPRRSRRPHPRHADGAPLQLRAVVDAGAGDGRRARLRCRSTTRACSTSTRSTRCCARRAKVRGGRPRLQRASGRSTRSPRSRGAPAPPARRRWSTARRPCRRCRSTSARSDADFYAWTGHKAYGPTGVGVLHGRRDAARHRAADRRRAHDLQRVVRRRSAGPTPPARFEAGTSAIAEVIGLGAAVDWLAGDRAWRTSAPTSRR